MAQITADNNYAVAKFIVDAVPGQGTHTTITAAMAAASSGDVIWVRGGTYTENFTITPGVYLTGTRAAVVNGKITYVGGATTNIQNITLQTNSDFALVFSGSTGGTLLVSNCDFNCAQTAISYTSSSSSTGLVMLNCSGNFSTASGSMFAHSSAGNLSIQDTYFFNITGTTVAASTASSGGIFFRKGFLGCPLTISGTASSELSYIQFDGGSGATVTISLTSTSSSQQMDKLLILANSATALSIGASSSCSLSQSTILSTNTNAISGTGTLNKGVITFTGSSSTIQGTLTVNTFTTS